MIPVFWMATEDHDLAEVDHAFVADRKVQWKTSASGAVGRMTLKGIEAPLEEAITAMGTGAFADEIADLLRACYRPEATLAEATRRFVLALFGRFGLITVDGDDPSLKRSFTPVMREEVLNQVTQRTVAYANERIAARYTVQAHAREINLFHLRPGHRSRIVLEGDHYVVLDGGPRWTVDQLLQELEHRSEDFSPNVLLRPIYQETVLPNIAYIGGGGELAYWMQLRWLFQGLQVSMPVVMLRTSAGSIPEKRLRHWLGSGAGISGLFAPLDAMKAQVAVQQVPYSTDVEKEIERLNATYTELSVRAAAADATLKNAVEARRVQAIRGLEQIQKGLIRAAKHDQHVLMQRMDAAHAALFPGGGLQERKANMLPTLVAKGPRCLMNGWKCWIHWTRSSPCSWTNDLLLGPAHNSIHEPRTLHAIAIVQAHQVRAARQGKAVQFGAAIHGGAATNDQATGHVHQFVAASCGETVYCGQHVRVAEHDQGPGIHSAEEHGHDP
ncbi:MAG: bacillithiol biosynthesis cysteine-adding enzyme BshC [Flavobacteriales bacterium]|nr:bacillithiol biosynthesis cysteine-adding enzyme BshC [Flavobacteriales bacterium]